MKNWNQPAIEELDLNSTAYAPEKGSKIDGSYVSEDGKYTHNTYCPSGAEQPK